LALNRLAVSMLFLLSNPASAVTLPVNGVDINYSVI
jgi:hypothetical protein